VAVAFHGGLFNIGGEGQAMMGGLGAGWRRWPGGPAAGLADAAADGAGRMLFGMAWAAVPAALQAWRGSHIVITTIMFNFIASALLGYLLVERAEGAGNMAPESRAFADARACPGMHELLGVAGHRLAAHAAEPERCCWRWPRPAACGWLLWRSQPGYALRAVGFSPEAARYAGIAPRAQIMRSMMLSGALAGLVGINEIAGVQGRLMPTSWPAPASPASRWR
jgi:general nucleoside transport system permease protein